MPVSTGGFPRLRLLEVLHRWSGGIWRRVGRDTASGWSEPNLGLQHANRARGRTCCPAASPSCRWGLCRRDPAGTSFLCVFIPLSPGSLPTCPTGPRWVQVPACAHLPSGSDTALSLACGTCHPAHLYRPNDTRRTCAMARSAFRTRSSQAMNDGDVMIVITTVSGAETGRRVASTQAHERLAAYVAVLGPARCAPATCRRCSRCALPTSGPPISRPGVHQHLAHQPTSAASCCRFRKRSIESAPCCR
jgi:hypothetical protein